MASDLQPKPHFSGNAIRRWFARPTGASYEKIRDDSVSLQRARREREPETGSTGESK